MFKLFKDSIPCTGHIYNEYPRGYAAVISWPDPENRLGYLRQWEIIKTSRGVNYFPSEQAARNAIEMAAKAFLQLNLFNRMEILMWDGSRQN